MKKPKSVAKEIIEGLRGFLRGETCKHTVICRRCHGTGKVRNPSGDLATTKCKTCKGVGRFVWWS